MWLASSQVVARSFFVGTGGEFSSILASQVGFLPSFDQPICPGEYLRRNRHADLLGGFQLDDELELVLLGNVSERWVR